MTGPIATSDSATAIAHAVRGGTRTALDCVQAALNRIRHHNPAINAVTRILDDRACIDARRIDARITAGEDVGPLAGVPFVVKDVFDVAGLPTTAGAVARKDAEPATRDAVAIRRLADAGAVLVGTTNMDEYAYGFVTVNNWSGTTCNPHDRSRLAGGSSGGSAAAVAAGLVPVALGSDTNGSIRIPAALCGVYGLRPSRGAIDMQGVFPFAESLDTIGPLTATIDDMRLVCGQLMDIAPRPPAQADLRIVRLGGWFDRNLAPEMTDSIRRLDSHIGAKPVAIPGVDAARSSAFIVTAAEGGALHQEELRRRPFGFDPQTRDRLIAGTMIPASLYFAARQCGEQFRQQLEKLFDRYDILLTPTVPGVAPLIEQPDMIIDGKPVSARANLGLFTQPFGLAGLSAISVPLARQGDLPLGMQLLAPPGREQDLFDCIRRLEQSGLVGAAVNPGDPPETGIRVLGSGHSPVPSVAR